MNGKTFPEHATTDKATALAEDVIFLLDQGEDPATLYQRFGYADSEGLKKALLKVDADVAGRLPWKDPLAPPKRESRPYLKSSIGVILGKARETGAPEIIEAAERIDRELDGLTHAITRWATVTSKLASCQREIDGLMAEKQRMLDGLKIERRPA